MSAIASGLSHSRRRATAELAPVAIYQKRCRDTGGREVAHRRARLIDEDAKCLQPKLP